MRIKLPSWMVLICLCMGTNARAQWSVPVNISPGTTALSMNENSGQCLSVTGDTLRITYVDRSTAMSKVMYNESTDAGLTWGTAKVLDSSLNCSFTAIATFGSSVHVVWMDSLGMNRASFYRQSLDGGDTWDSVVCLDSVTKFWPGIACWDNLVVATLNKDLTGNTEVFIKRSIDFGATWLPEQQISNAPNRSEDPAINILGKDVHLSWNDKRSGVMNIYYCHSADSGATWGPEVPLTSADSYTSMVWADQNHVNVPHGIRGVNQFDVWLAESADTGSTFIPNQQITFATDSTELYPVMVRDGSNIHLAHIGMNGVYYRHSADGGSTWDPPVYFSALGQPFIAYTGCTVHLIYNLNGAVMYVRNPTGNCVGVQVKNVTYSNVISIFPDPATEKIFISNLPGFSQMSYELFSSSGIKIREGILRNNEIAVEDLEQGIYFIRIRKTSGDFFGKFIRQ